MTDILLEKFMLIMLNPLQRNFLHKNISSLAEDHLRKGKQEKHRLLAFLSSKFSEEKEVYEITKEEAKNLMSLLSFTTSYITNSVIPGYKKRIQENINKEEAELEYGPYIEKALEKNIQLESLFRVVATKLEEEL
jgi:hypothetical protein